MKGLRLSFSCLMFEPGEPGNEKDQETLIFKCSPYLTKDATMRSLARL